MLWLVIFSITLFAVTLDWLGVCARSLRRHEP